MKSARVISLVILTALCCLLVSCSQPGQGDLYRTNRLLMGTLVQITVVGHGDRAADACQAVVEEIQRVEDLTSFHKKSPLTELNSHAGEGPWKADPELLALIKKCLDVARMTDGAFDPTVGPVSRLWHFSDGEPKLPSGEEIRRALSKVGWRKVSVDQEAGTVTLAEKGMLLDLGAAAKGYALDRAARVLKERGVRSALINAGGDILALGTKAPGKPWWIGVQDPRHHSAVAAVTSMKDKCIVTSGDYERFFIKDGTRYHHILDPKTGYPARGIQSVTIVADDGFMADALATAVFVMGVKKGLRLVESRNGIEATIIDSESRFHMTPGAEKMFHGMR